LDCLIKELLMMLSKPILMECQIITIRSRSISNNKVVPQVVVLEGKQRHKNEEKVIMVKLCKLKLILIIGITIILGLLGKGWIIIIKVWPVEQFNRLQLLLTKGNHALYAEKRGMWKLVTVQMLMQALKITIIIIIIEDDDDAN
jgi:hypothetical protein